MLVSYRDGLLAELGSRCAAMPAAGEVLRQLRDHVALGVVSNFPEADFVHGTLAQFGLSPWLDVVVVSVDVGRMKPHPLPFQVALDSLSVDATEVLFVGDDLGTTDVAVVLGSDSG